jgi:hypothetical protein
MVPSVTTILQRLKTAWAAQLQPDAIHTACQKAGYTSWRDRLLNPVITVQLLLLQILHGNTACQHLPHLSGLRFSASASCQARAKLPLSVLTHLLERLGHAAQPALSKEGRWHGHRTFSHSHETKMPLYGSGRTKTPLTISGLKKDGSWIAPATTSFRAPSECHGCRRPR